MKFATMIFWVLLVTAVYMGCTGCSTPPKCSVCDECSACEDEEVEALFGSHDFFLEGEDKITSSKLATKCLTCGIYFTYPDYGEHIKTCCP